MQDGHIHHDDEDNISTMRARVQPDCSLENMEVEIHSEYLW